MIVGSRVLTVRHDGLEHAVTIVLHLPEMVGQSWDCRYEIDWPDAPVRSFAGGNDAIAALFAAIEKIGMELHMSRYHHERTMWWLKPWEGYGFPLPKGARDELIGDDQRFFGVD
ncbi:MAG: hypothetical protein ABS75_14010 [Pelagibacterium sp. SCN 63-23]|nr:MAG: hypothetical protein ABS75_14010 [Pelagibacterium sp. SCN 63-23]